MIVTLRTNLEIFLKRFVVNNLAAFVALGAFHKILAKAHSIRIASDVLGAGGVTLTALTTACTTVETIVTVNARITCTSTHSEEGKTFTLAVLFVAVSAGDCTSRMTITR